MTNAELSQCYRRRIFGRNGPVSANLTLAFILVAAMVWTRDYSAGFVTLHGRGLIA